MSLSQLSNYLLSNRKRLALSQEEVAFLLGLGSGEEICRHERFAREPSLEIALAYEVIYKRSASELFSGLYQRIEEEVLARAKTLLKKTDHQSSSQRTARRRRVLSDLSGIQPDN